MLIPQQPHRHLLYGDDAAATRRVDATRTALRRRARRIPQRAARDRAARVSRRTGTNNALRPAAPGTCASDCTPGAIGTTATKTLTPAGPRSMRSELLGFTTLDFLDPETCRFERAVDPF